MNRIDTGAIFMDNEELVKHYQNGEGEALELLIKDFHPKLVRTIYHYTKDKASVEDLAQESWYAIIGQLTELELHISFEAWALTIARRKSIDWIRSKQRSRNKDKELEARAKEQTQKNGIDDKDERLEKVQSEIQKLSLPHRVVLRLFYLENLSLTEISNVLNISKGTVKSRLFYAREKLKNKINQ